MKKLLLNQLTLFLATLALGTAQATSLYSGTASLHISIDNISNISNPDSGYGNDIFYSDSGPSGLTSDSESIINGVGSTPLIQYSSTAISSTPTVLQPFSFEQHMDTNLSVSNGDISSYYFGEFLMVLSNSSSDTYQIDLTIDAVLQSTATGEFSESSMSFSTENLGTDLEFIEVYSNSQTGSVDSYQYPATLHHLILTAGENKNIYSGAEFSGFALASPVPLPGAFWLLSLGLLSLIRLKRKINLP